MSPTTPTISIITIVFNRKDDIMHTLESIIQQTYTSIEYIVIDGGSTDGTKELIERYKEKIDHFVSEKDKGIYDAMNKGLKFAQGDYVLFINGGDQLHDHNTIENVFKDVFQNGIEWPDIIYGECMLMDGKRQYITTRSKYRHQEFPQELNHYSFKLGTNVSHQSFIVRRNLTSEYNLRYRWSSDVDWMLHCLKKAKKTHSYPYVISDFVIGDSSTKHKISSLKERFLIMGKHYGWASTLFAHTCIVFNKLFNVLYNKSMKI